MSFVLTSLWIICSVEDGTTIMLVRLTNTSYTFPVVMLPQVTRMDENPLFLTLRSKSQNQYRYRYIQSSTSNCFHSQSVYFPQPINDIKIKNGVRLRSHGRSENYETTWRRDFKTLRRFFSQNLLERSFRLALFSLTCLFCIFSVGLSCIEEFSCWDSVHFFSRYFFTRGLVNLYFYFQIVIDLIFSSIFCNRR